MGRERHLKHDSVYRPATDLGPIADCRLLVDPNEETEAELTSSRFRRCWHHPENEPHQISPGGIILTRDYIAAHWGKFR